MSRFDKWHMLFGLLLGVLGAILTVLWFGWQMLLVIFLLLWSNNISVKGSN